ncbi:Hypothetical protein, putative [Bodo saltans]|uniref:Uncharacterized protein n=1 Tax=Bodo saltans TaxID=75058 RepID=A0A0S4IJY6_BODSA|nr:Hypothetical protein, putative [Bodo saltans]|eukprot:CUE61709.1 Hypothetical protein, putative [Bodo saltans]
MIVSGVQIWRTGWSVFVTMYREPQLRDDDEPHNNALHSTIHQAQEKEAFYDDNIEFGGNDEELFPLHHDDVAVGVEDAMNVVDAKIKCDDDGGALEGLFWDADGNARTQPRGGRPITYERNNESDTALHFAFQVNDSDRDYDGDDKRLKYV